MCRSGHYQKHRAGISSRTLAKCLVYNWTTMVVFADNPRARIRAAFLKPGASLCSTTANTDSQQ